MKGHELPRDERGARALWSRLAEPGDPRLPTLAAEHGMVGALRVVAEGQDPRHQAFRDRLDAVVPGQDLQVAERCGARVLVPGDREWPPGVEDLRDVRGEDLRPACLWVRGPLSLADAVARSVAIVGSRAATDYGLRTATELSAGLVDVGFGILSGAAFGIDAAAHRGALVQDGITVAVLAGGVERPYPAAHANLLAAVATSGLVVSEVAPGCAPTRHRFLRRNRLIAALARGTVVVEAGLRSGALSTARHADSLSRPLGAVPGPVTSAASAGCHELIRSGAAMLVTDAPEVAELCGDYGVDVAPDRRGERRAEDVLLPQDSAVLGALPTRTAVPVTSVALAAGVTVGEARASTTRLEQAGLAETCDGGWRLSAAARRDRSARRDRVEEPARPGTTPADRVSR